MLIAVLMISVVALGVGAAALAMAVLAILHGTAETPPVAPPIEGAKDAAGRKLSDAKMQEGISNLLGYEVGGGKGDE